MTLLEQHSCHSCGELYCVSPDPPNMIRLSRRFCPSCDAKLVKPMRRRTIGTTMGTHTIRRPDHELRINQT